MTMERAMLSFLFAFIFCVVVQGKVGTHICLMERKTWNEAQAYCRGHYTDLSYINSPDDNEEVRQLLSTNIEQAWIGLQRDFDNGTQWGWSGGGNVTYEHWDSHQPDNYLYSENKGTIKVEGHWNDGNENWPLPFCCIHITLSAEEKTWEEALEHCRGEGKDLVSIDTETEQLLVQSVIQKKSLYKVVWIGLRFLPDRWLWVNGSPMVYEAWSQEDDNWQCPLEHRCGALNRFGLWKARDCLFKRHFICN